MTDTIPAPEADGWYGYSGGNQVMIFRRTRGQWYAAFDSGEMHPCEWGYIEQALGVWDVVPLVPASRVEAAS